MNLDFWLRAMTILVFIIVRVYWYKAKYKSNLEKHKTQNKSLTIEKIGIVISALIIGISVLGFTLFTFENVTIQLLGFILVILGSMEAILGRLALGNNWTESYEYQIKKKHELVIHGLYKYVRHPIYGGFMIAVTGAFIVAKTYLFIPLFFFQLILMTNFAKREERLLGSYFGKEYIIYMQKTKMFIPFIF
ncbi:MAG TPA: isoprenylcysteine carboxylmethyltransferase family protein [Patescibacteria group bacterium]|nr:isoprenylcysteine carboxylmethyltransferase family protein [Patescibacteria group bacterium]